MNTFVYKISYSTNYSNLQEPNTTSIFPSTPSFLLRYCTPFTLATFWEILFAIFASIITSIYTLNHEDQGFGFSEPIGDVPFEAFELESLAFLVDPSPPLMLSCCLILGISVSSFIYRRQEYDFFQTPIFILVTGVAITLGVGMRVHSNLIMLGLIPWALCFAMVTSSLGHWFFRRCGRQRPRVFYGIDEREILIRKS